MATSVDRTELDARDKQVRAITESEEFVEALGHGDSAASDDRRAKDGASEAFQEAMEQYSEKHRHSEPNTRKRRPQDYGR